MFRIKSAIRQVTFSCEPKQVAIIRFLHRALRPSIEFFKFKKTQLKRSRLDNDSSVMFQSSNVTRASYEIALLIANQKSIHNRRNCIDTLWFHCIIKTAKLLLE